MSLTGNSFGKILKITTFGESHGNKIGVLIEGIPSDIPLKKEDIEKELKRRRPGASEIVTPRDEKDSVEIVSGLFEGKTTGTPIVLMTENTDFRSDDYHLLKNSFRPTHADYTYFKKYGHYDYRGGGRASARETWGRVAAGAVVKLILKKYFNIEILSFVTQIGPIALPTSFDILKIKVVDIEKSKVRCPDLNTSKKMVSLIKKVKEENDSVGGIIKCVIKNVPAGIGEPVYDRYEAELSKAILSIPSVRGFEIGDGFMGALKRGSEVVDEMRGDKKNSVKFLSNHAGGIMGGISRGDEIIFSAAFRAPATIKQKLKTIDHEFNNKVIEMGGRHDPCVLPRAVPVVDAMAALVTYDLILRNKLTKI